MNELFTYSLTVFTGFFAVMNPIANTPIFMGLVEDKDDAAKRKVAQTATITAFIIVTAFVILGKYIFEPAFKITGGILIFYIGFEMLMSQKSKVHNTRNTETTNSVAISPLAIPILAGPGTIVAAMNFVTDANYLHIAIVVVLFGLMIGLTYIAFTLSDWIVEKVGHHLIAVIGKIMGLILAIIGTGMVVEGVKLAFNI